VTAIEVAMQGSNRSNGTNKRGSLQGLDLGIGVPARNPPAPLDDIEPSTPGSPANPRISALKGALRNSDGGVDATPTLKAQKSHARFASDEEDDDGFAPGSMDSSATIITVVSPESSRASGAYSPSSRSPSQRLGVMRKMTSRFGFGREQSMGNADSYQKFTMSNAGKVKGVVGIIGFGAVSWFLLSSVLLVLFGQQYDGVVVDEDQARYATSAAERAAVNAAAVLGAALATRDAVDYAIKSKLYFEPMDYAGARAAVEPVFAGFPSLRAVDLAFTGREDFITVRRLVSHGEAVGAFMSMSPTIINVRAEAALAMQSSAADCRKLGERGCLSSANASSQRWHRLASGLWAGEETDGFRKPSDEVFRWDEQPGFVPQDPSRAGATYSVAWTAAYSSVFRSAFPGTSGRLSVLGRSVTELSGLRINDQLSDENLGANGAIYIVDRAGCLLAAAEAGNQAFIKPNGGVFRFRKLGEVEARWASKLKAFDGSPQSFYSEGFYVVVKPLRGRGLANFSAVVAADRAVFVDSRLSPMLNGAKVVAVIPYPVFVLVLVILHFHRSRQRRQNLRRVHVLHEGMATLEHSSAGLADDFSKIACMTKLRQRTQEKLIAAERDAKSSMSDFLAVSVFAKPKGDAETETQLALASG